MKTSEDFMSELIYNAESGNHRKFCFLRSWYEYLRAKKVRQTHRLLVSSIRQSADRLFKRYCKAIEAGETDVIKLLAYCTTVKVLSFYEEELSTISDMVIEYECYLANGNWLDFLFDTQRPVNKLFDHRGL